VIHKNWQDFLDWELLTESTLRFSSKFLDILSSIENDRIAQEILKAYKELKDSNYIANYIEVSPLSNDTVDYTPSSKAERILSQIPELWKKTSSSGLLTYNKTTEGKWRNNNTFERLSYHPTQEDADYALQPDDVFMKIRETRGSSGKIYALIRVAKWNGSDFIPKNIYKVINIQALKPFQTDLEKNIWNTQRASFRIGKLAVSILSTLGITYTPQEIEKFVNGYKACYDILNSQFSKFDIITGDDIAKWYRCENYQSQSGSLGNSCMRSKRGSYFDLYSKNPEVCSLVILYSNDGKISGGKWVSQKIVGRALLWKLDDGRVFLDRIYTIRDYDIEKYKAYARHQGWITIGSSGKKKCSLKRVDFDYYPYVDTLRFLSRNPKFISETPEHTTIGVLQSQEGNLRNYR
jgi:hypothetical protein